VEEEGAELGGEGLQSGCAELADLAAALSLVAWGYQIRTRTLVSVCQGSSPACCLSQLSDLEKSFYFPVSQGHRYRPPLSFW
jgi:hypothetical protein